MTRLTGGVSSTLKPSGQNYQTLSKEAYEEAYGTKYPEFSNTAAAHMDNPNRYVPLQLMDDTVKNESNYSDPQKSSGNMYYSEMYKNKQLYNLEILYDKSTNTIWHFEYAKKTMGSLPKIAMPK